MDSLNRQIRPGKAATSSIVRAKGRAKPKLDWTSGMRSPSRGGLQPLQPPVQGREYRIALQFPFDPGIGIGRTLAPAQGLAAEMAL